MAPKSGDSAAQWTFLALGSVDPRAKTLRQVEATSPDFPGWRFIVDVSFAGELLSFTMAPVEQGSAPSGGITAKALRRFPIGSLRDAARRYGRERLVANAEAITAGYSDPRDAAVIVSDNAGFVNQLAKTGRPGRPGRPDIFYARLAASYVALLGGEKPVIQALAEAEYLSVSQTRDLIREARKRGMLTSVAATPGARRPGRPGGSLTPKAEALIAQEAP